VKKCCAARLPGGEPCGNAATVPEPELHDLVCIRCALRLDRRRWHRSYHQAGRAIALDHLGIRSTAISLRAPVWPRTAAPAPWATLSAEGRCLFLLAGGVAEDFAVPICDLDEVDPPIDDIDVAYARRFARSLVRDESGVETYLEAIRQDATRLFANRRVAVEGLARALFERLRLNADEVATIIAPGMRTG
jgi:hypothetical protein